MAPTIASEDPAAIFRSMPSERTSMRGGAPADGFDESAAHDLHIAADERLQIGCAGIE